MNYITELDTDRIEKISGKLPDNSALVKLDGRTFALNVSVGIWNSSQYGASFELTAAKDTNGRFVTTINHNLVAIKLYEIAEPDGADWEYISHLDKEKYIRMQDAGVKP